MTTVFKLSDKVAAFKAKLELQRRRVNTGTFYMFHTLAGIIEETEVEPSFCQLVHDHLLQLKKTPKRRMNGSFVNKLGQSTLSLVDDEQLVETANDGDLRSMFETTSNLFAFWVKVKAEYPDIATEALKALLPFHYRQ